MNGIKVLIAIFLFHLTLSQGKIMLSLEFINEINRSNSTWTAGQNFHPDTPRDYLQRIASGVHPSHEAFLPKKIVSHPEENEIIPASFDARQAWPECPGIGEIWDQGGCGSCWAFGAVPAMSGEYICVPRNHQMLILIVICCKRYCCCRRRRQILFIIPSII